MKKSLFIITSLLFVSPVYALADQNPGNQVVAQEHNPKILHIADIFHQTSDSNRISWANSDTHKYVSGYDSDDQPIFKTYETGYKAEIYNTGGGDHNINHVDWVNHIVKVKDFTDIKGREYSILSDQHDEKGSETYSASQKNIDISDSYGNVFLSIVLTD